MEITIRQAGTEDLPEILRIMDTVSGEMEHPEHCFADDPDFIANHIPVDITGNNSVRNRALAALRISRWKRPEKNGRTCMCRCGTA